MLTEFGLFRGQIKNGEPNGRGIFFNDNEKVPVDFVEVNNSSN